MGGVILLAARLLERDEPADPSRPGLPSDTVGRAKPAPQKFRAPLSPRRTVAWRRRRLAVPGGTPDGGWGGGWAGVPSTAWTILAADRRARALQLAGRGGRQPGACSGRGRPPGGHPRAPSHRVYLRGVRLRGRSDPTKMLADARPTGCLRPASVRLGVRGGRAVAAAWIHSRIGGRLGGR